MTNMDLSKAINSLRHGSAKDQVAYIVSLKTVGVLGKRILALPGDHKTKLAIKKNILSIAKIIEDYEK